MSLPSTAKLSANKLPRSSSERPPRLSFAARPRPTVRLRRRSVTADSSPPMSVRSQ